MNITMRKLAMIEKSMKEAQEQARISGYTTVPVDTEMQRRITDLMDRVRSL